MSYGEPIALRGQRELEQVALAAPVEVRRTAETEFIERLKRGEEAAYEVLIAERSGEIYGLLYRLTENREEARDLTQETFLRAFQSIRNFRGDADLKTWIYRIAINQARNRWRWWSRRSRDSTVSEGELKTWPATPVRSIAVISQLGLVLDFVGVASLNGSSRGRPAIQRF